MKRTKKVNRFCPHCRKHTEQTVSLAKKKERGSLKHGAIARIKKRGRARGFGNWGRFSRPSKPKMSGKKASKKVDLRFTCSVCKKTSTGTGFRAKKLELK